MKKFLYISLIFTGLLSLALFSVSLFRSWNLPILTAEPAPLRLYHFSLYLPDNRNSFLNGIIKGAEAAAAELNAAISIHSIDPARSDLDYAAFAGVDGVIVCPYLDYTIVRRQLEKLRGNETQAKFGNDLGYSQALISQWEKGDKIPSLENIANVADKFSVSPAWLLGFSEIKNPTGSSDELLAQQHIEFLSKILEGKCAYFCLMETYLKHKDEDETSHYADCKEVLAIKNPILLSFLEDYKKKLSIIKEFGSVIDEMGFDAEEAKKRVINMYVEKFSEEFKKSNETLIEAGLEVGGTNE